MISFRMQSGNLKRIIRLTALSAVIITVLWFIRSTVADALSLIAGASVICFLIDPLARLYCKHMGRGAAVLCALTSCLCLLIAFVLLILPAMVAEGAQLTHTLPESVSVISFRLAQVQEWMKSHFPGLVFSVSSLTSDHFPSLAIKTFHWAGSFAGSLYRFSLMIVLSYFLMRDKIRVLLLLEQLIPMSMRRTAVRMGNAVCRELGTYLRSQAIISALVGALTSIGLAAAGLDSAVILGAIVGILNMIPYFGPIIGAIPAVFIAMGEGMQATVITIAVLWLVQQIDSTLISPRVMSSQTGISPAVVLLSIFVGSGLGGILGMLLAMPIVMTIRTVFRVFVQRYENV